MGEREERENSGENTKESRKVREKKRGAKREEIMVEEIGGEREERDEGREQNV